MALTLQLEIGTHRFKVMARDESDKQKMLQAARSVEKMLEDMRTNNKAVDGERAAIMVALQLAAGGAGGGGADAGGGLDQLEAILDDALQTVQA